MNRSATSSFRTPHNTLLTGESKYHLKEFLYIKYFRINLDAQFDDRRTFLTEFTNEEEDNANNDEKQKSPRLTSIQQTNSVNEFMKKNYVIKVLEIKTMTTSSSLKRDRTKSASDKNSLFSRKGNMTAKST